MTEYKGHKHDFYLTENIYLMKNGTTETTLSATLFYFVKKCI